MPGIPGTIDPKSPEYQTAVAGSPAIKAANDTVAYWEPLLKTAKASLDAANALASLPDTVAATDADVKAGATASGKTTKANVGELIDNPAKPSATQIKERVKQAQDQFDFVSTKWQASKIDAGKAEASVASELQARLGGQAPIAVTSGGITQFYQWQPDPDRPGQSKQVLVSDKQFVDDQLAAIKDANARAAAAAAASRMPNIQQLKIIRTNDKGQKEAVVQFVNADTGEYVRDAKGDPKEISAGDVPLGQRDLIEQVRADTGANGSPPGLYKYTFDLATNEVLKDANGNPLRSYVGPIPQEPTPATFQLAPGRTGYLQKGEDGKWKVVTLNVDPTQEALATKQLAKLQQDIERGTLDLSKLTWQRDKGAWDTELEAQKATLAQAQAATGLTTAQTTGTTLNNAKTAVDVAAKQREAFVDDLVQRGLMTPERGLAYLEGQYTALKAWYDIQKQQEELRATALKERQSDIDRSITLADRYATWGGYGGTNAQYAANAQGITDKYAKPGEGLGAAILRSTGGGQGLDRNIPAPLTAPQASAYEQAHPNGIFAGNDEFDAFVRRMNASATPGATVTPLTPATVPGAIASSPVSALALTGTAPTEASLARDYGASFGGSTPSLAPPAMAWGGPDDEATRDAKLRHLLDLATPSIATPGPMGALGAFGR